MEELFTEAADAYGMFLHGRELDGDTTGQFYGYAGLLARGGRSDEAADIYRRILRLRSDYRKARENLKVLESTPVRTGTAPPAEARPDPPASGPPSDRVIDEGDALSRADADGVKSRTTLRNMIVHGNLDPRHSMKIWVNVLKAVSRRHVEKIFAGSLGVILYEMVTGSLEGSVTPGPRRFGRMFPDGSTTLSSAARKKTAVTDT